MDDWAHTIATIQAAWTSAFERRDAPALASLYTADAALYGSRPELYRGRTGVTRYFAELPSRFKRVRFMKPALVVLTRDAVAASGAVTFETEEHGTVQFLRYRMTHVVVQHDAHCLIATHHASPEP